ncbi:DNA gyrase subunit A [Exiguobacterium sp. SH3S2]|uniref:DNA gyrase subunit A n=1 Tax=unclassified Exiguobacterium TaxID=2644629 RepID=UPI00103EB9B1|nr:MULTISPECIES: DNA gyrase subunit A [unclassified Exiguobacterium]TCI47448.1 DNA gyrase subunit A [Exiguobacterium sp. SH3S3]TCI53921.1 DNA gyrase subunit A [Exiguobacterium sp. SH5S13]TCI60403.1 DNA gyrase subunit A [Exiguobacterium sp. SH3S1]TCI62595.1 DNA gyrase subunit A [Exiguobacterium sp. SH3S2]
MAEQENIKDINISQEMRTSFMDYAMSVIVSRALPDVRDGLKPVHRRILYAMNELGIRADKPHKKSARVVGDVIGKYHPHGDSAVYETMVRMAQDFSYRYELVDGHGNFGSVDGDSAAAMRYTEARMSKIAMELVRDIGKNTIDYQANFDGEEKEPVVMPARFPNFLVNGTSGIAVGMATNVPPHNLNEVIDGVLALTHNPDITISELMQYIPGPDFPTSGEILGRSGIRRAYETGRGSITMRAKAEIQVLKNGRERILIHEIPYQVNKARLVEKIADLVRDKKIEGITDLRDESDRNGMRVVIEVRRDANASVILNNLYKQTPMQTTFGVNMLALVGGRPKTLNLKQAIYYYIEHQKEVVRRRTQFDLDKAEARAHILEGLRVALDHLDEVIAIIRSTRTGDEAREKLIARFGLSTEQTQAILDMRLQRLTGLEREKIEGEYREIRTLIEELRAILGDEELLLEIIRNELTEIKERYGDARRTVIRTDIIELEDEDLIPVRDMMIALTSEGYIKSIPSDSYRTQRRGGRGKQGMGTNDEDFVLRLLSASTHDTILFFTNFGRVFRLKGYEIPEMSRTAKGMPIINLLQVDKGEKVETMIPVDFNSYLADKAIVEDAGEGSEEEEVADEQLSLVFITKHGLVKRSPLSAYARINKNGLRAISLNDSDELVTVRLAKSDDEMLIVTHAGMSIRFPLEGEVRSMGRTARGVRAIRLKKDDDRVVSMEIVRPTQDVLIITEKGYGKRTAMEQFRTQGRGGSGIIGIKTDRGTVVGMRVVDEDDDIMLMTELGVAIRIDAQTISQMGRSTRGVKVMNIEDGDRLATIAKLKKDELEDELEEESTVDVENGFVDEAPEVGPSSEETE